MQSWWVIGNKRERGCRGASALGCHSLEHLASLYGGEPKAVSIRIVIARSSAVALDEWGTSKLFQTGPRGCKGLARTFSTSAGVLWGKHRRESEVVSPEPRERFTIPRKQSGCLLREVPGPSYPILTPGSPTLSPQNCSTAMVVHHLGLLASLGHSGLHTIPETRHQLLPVRGECPAFLENNQEGLSCQMLRLMIVR